MIDLRRTQLEQILAQVRTFLKSPPIPRQHAQVDPEKSFTTPAFGDAPKFDDFLNTKDKRGKKHLLEISRAVDRANALLQALSMYSDVIRGNPPHSQACREVVYEPDRVALFLEAQGELLHYPLVLDPLGLGPPDPD